MAGDDDDVTATRGGEVVLNDVLGLPSSELRAFVWTMTVRVGWSVDMLEQDVYGQRVIANIKDMNSLYVHIYGYR